MPTTAPLFGAIPGGPEMLIILLVLVLLFGAQKIPKLARSTGQAMGEFKKGREEVEDELQNMQEETVGEMENTVNDTVGDLNEDETTTANTATEPEPERESGTDRNTN